MGLFDSGRRQLSGDETGGFLHFSGPVQKRLFDNAFVKRAECEE